MLSNEISLRKKKKAIQNAYFFTIYVSYQHQIKLSRTYLEVCAEKYKIEAHHFQNTPLGLLEKIHVIEFFLLPTDILILILTTFISIDSLTVFDTSISDSDSRRYLLQYIFPSPKFVVPSIIACYDLSTFILFSR